MFRFPLAVRTLVLGVAAIVCTTASTSAQSHEERARMILQLFETGQTDSAYQLIEPLKKEARFVPAVIFTRAKMTPDDRALNLFRELIALEPGGSFADDAVHELVRRYIEKRDSMAAYTWLGVMHTNYPRSSFLTASEESLKGVITWMIADDLDGPDKDSKATATKSSATTKTKTETTKTDATKPADTYRKSGMRGFALQVGLFPTRAAAEKRAVELTKKKLKAVALPKMVDGKKHYALVVGPYKTADDAGKKKPSIATGCDCAAFIVKVE